LRVEKNAKKTHKKDKTAKAQATAQVIHYHQDQPRPMRVTHLSDYKKVVAHFFEYTNDPGTADYHNFMTKPVSDVLRYKYIEYNDVKQFKGRQFNTATKAELAPFIAWYASTELGQISNTDANDDVAFCSKLASLNLHNFVNTSTDRRRTQDLTSDHISAFVVNIITIFNANNRPVSNCEKFGQDDGLFIFPVNSLANYRDIITAWLKSLREFAPRPCAGYFESLSRELEVHYLHPDVFDHPQYDHGGFKASPRGL
jgi:hypothetical protein